MTSTEYQSARKERGTQDSVAALLGVSRVTVARREIGEIPVTREAELALLSIPKNRKANKILK